MAIINFDIEYKVLSTIIVVILEYLVCGSTLIVMGRWHGKTGLLSYNSLATVIANIQVLKTVALPGLAFPVAWGTTVFSSTFLATDLITELYGPTVAKQSISISFCSCLFVSLIMFLTNNLTPAFEDNVSLQAHHSIQTLFTPAPRILVASLLAYCISQHLDVWLFQKIKNLTGYKWLGVRTSIASLFSALIDNIIFSTLAWLVLAEKPVSFNQLLYTYILSTYILRVIAILLQTPLIYVIRSFIKKN